MPKEALVVKREILFRDKSFQGFLSSKDFDFFPVIQNNYFYRERGDDLEHDFSLQQIIPYVIIVNPKTKKVFAYRRAPNENYTEVRLRNKWSIGLGGHIERKDNQDPIKQGMIRELKEEVKMDNYPDPTIVGYLKDDKGDVERVHFGIVALVETSGNVEKGDEEMAEGRFFSINEFEDLAANQNNSLEEWTKISWPFVKNYLYGLK